MQWCAFEPMVALSALRAVVPGIVLKHFQFVVIHIFLVAKDLSHWLEETRRWVMTKVVDVVSALLQF